MEICFVYLGAQQCSRPLLAVLYNTLPQVSPIDAFVLFLQSLNPKYPHLFPVTSDSSNLASRLLCHIASLGHWTVLVLATHIFAPDSRLEFLIRFCHACIDMNDQLTPTFLTSKNSSIGLGQSSIWFNQLTTDLCLCVFRQVSSHSDIRSIFHALGEQNDFYQRFEPLFSLLDEQPSPVPFDWALVMYKDRCYRSIMSLIEQLFKHDRFDLVDEIIICVDIEIDITLFERFRCSFNEYKHTPQTDDKELNEAFDTICQGHQDVLKRLKKPLLYGDFLLSVRSISSKLVRILLLIFANQAQNLPEPYEYSPTQLGQEQHILDKLWTALVDFVYEYQNRPIVMKVLDYMVSLFSTSVLDQLARETLIPSDFDDYLRIFEENEAEEEIVEEEKLSNIIPENEFEAALLKNVFTNNKITSTTETVLTSISNEKPSNRRPSSRASSSSQAPAFAPAFSRRSSGSLSVSTGMNLHHLSDKEIRSCLTIIEDAFLARLAPELCVQIAAKFRMASYNLTVVSYAHRVYLNLLLPIDARTRFEQLPQPNTSGPLNKKRLTNVLRTMTVTLSPDDQSNDIADQKQAFIDRLASRTSTDDRLISLINTLFKISRLFRIDSCQLLTPDEYNDEWEILKRTLLYPSSSFPTKIKLASSFAKQLKLANQQLVELIVEETDRTLERWQKNEVNDDYHSWPFDPSNIESYKQFLALLHEKNYDAIGRELVERSRNYEDQYLASEFQGSFRTKLSFES